MPAHLADTQLPPIDAPEALPSLESIRWRVDVTISHTALSRVFKPSVVLELNLADASATGSHPHAVTMEVSAENLARLRYEVARALKHTHEITQSRQ